MFSPLVVFLCLFFSFADAASVEPRQPTDNDLRTISSLIWDADVNRITGDNVQYDINGPVLFTYVNESMFVGTYELFIALLDNYIPDVTMDDLCGTACTDEQNAFINAIMETECMQLAHQFLVDHALAPADVASFKTTLRQYWFMRYTRGGGPLGSSGFEHVFVGEVKNNEVSGSHNWVQFYLEEQQGDFVYGAHQDTCQPELVKMDMYWLGYHKPITSPAMRASPEAELAIYTICLAAQRFGGDCPVLLDGHQQWVTVWDMADIPLTVGTAYFNC